MINLFKFLKNNDDIIKDIVQPIHQSGDDSVASGDGAVMVVEDVFSISGRGTIATGRVEAGSFRINDDVRIVKADGSGEIQTKIMGIEVFRKSLDSIQAGDNGGILLQGVSRSDINRGDRIEAKKN